MASGNSGEINSEGNATHACNKLTLHVPCQATANVLKPCPPLNACGKFYKFLFPLFIKNIDSVLYCNPKSTFVTTHKR